MDYTQNYIFKILSVFILLCSKATLAIDVPPEEEFTQHNSTANDAKVSELLVSESSFEVTRINRLDSLVHKVNKSKKQNGGNYPKLWKMPKTGFHCHLQKKMDTYYADVEAQCQVFHLCSKDKRSYSFLCPNGTVFDNQMQICNWWQKVDCSSNSNLFPVKNSPRQSRTFHGNYATLNSKNGSHPAEEEPKDQAVDRQGYVDFSAYDSNGWDNDEDLHNYVPDHTSANEYYQPPSYSEDSDGYFPQRELHFENNRFVNGLGNNNNHHPNEVARLPVEYFPQNDHKNGQIEGYTYNAQAPKQYSRPVNQNPWVGYNYPHEQNDNGQVYDPSSAIEGVRVPVYKQTNVPSIINYYPPYLERNDIKDTLVGKSDKTYSVYRESEVSPYVPVFLTVSKFDERTPHFRSKYLAIGPNYNREVRKIKYEFLETDPRSSYFPVTEQTH